MALLRTTVNRAPQTALTTRSVKRTLGEPMSDVTLRSIVKEEIHTAVGFVGGDVSEDRRRAMDYYLGDPFGNEQEGRSQVVSTDVQDTIETVMPDLLEIFAGGDEVVRFEPVGMEDEPFASQATDYCNHIWDKDNDGFGITHDWIKDALLQKNGVVKIYWDESEHQERETLQNINSLHLAELEADKEVEIVEYEERPVEDPQILPFAPDGIVHDATIIRTTTKGRVKVVPVPPEEFLIARRSVSLGPDDYAFACHKTRKTASDLLQMGYSQEVVESIPSHDDQDYNEERVSRFDDDEWPELDDSLDPAMREIWLYECYLKVDYDGDGITEMRQVTVAGPGYQLLENEAVDDHPFASLTPIRMPHKFFGRSLADLTSDIQLIKSTMQRQFLDHIYNVNNNRTAVSDKVDLDDLLTNRPGGIVRVDTTGPDVAGHILPLPPSTLGSVILPMLEYWDGIREMRTGVTRLNQGLDPESLNKTATGINQLLGRTQRRVLLIARVFAETGFKSAFKKILNLVVTHQKRARIIRLRNEWVEMNPQAWNTDMDVTITVGLGYGTKEQQVAMLDRVLQSQAGIVQMQGGANGPLITLDNVYHTYKKWLVANGLKDSEAHISDPKDAQQVPQEQPPDPKLIEVQGKQQEAIQKLQLEQARLQEEQRQHGEEMQFKYTELDAKFGLDRDKIQVDLAKVDVEREQKGADRELKAAEMQNGAVSEVVKGLQESAKTLAQASKDGEGNSLQKAAEQLSAVAEALARPKRVVRDDKGNISGVETV